jgi:hypothetical protein
MAKRSPPVERCAKGVLQKKTPLVRAGGTPALPVKDDKRV